MTNRNIITGALMLVLVAGMTSPAFAQVQSSDLVEGNVATQVEIQKGICGQVDLTFAIDTTGSMGNAIDNVVANLPAITAQADDADLDTARIGLITFNGGSGLDFATVIHDLSTARATVDATLASLTTEAPGGGGTPEASNLAKRYAIENSNGFTAPWIGDTNILVVITDNIPGGANDFFDLGIDDVDMANLGTDASNHVPKIFVSDVYVAPSEDAQTRDILTSDAVNSGGFYTFTPNGVDTAQAIIDIIANCGDVPRVAGEMLSLDNSALVIAGLSSMIWIAPAAVGIAGIGIFVAKSRLSKNEN